MLLLDRVLRTVVAAGTLDVTWPDGRTVRYGTPGTGPAAAIRVRDAATARRVALNPSLAFGEAWMDGAIDTVGDSTLYDVLDLLMRNLAKGRMPWHARAAERVARWFRRLQQRNPARRARRNVAHHYDLSGRLYSLFLDRDRQYSCAYFPTGNETLEQAQVAKKRHIAAKLCLDRPGLRVLDIGSGWGGLALTLAAEYGADVTGITLSEEQFRESNARAEAAGLSHRVRFLLRDYRSVTDRFDRIVSVGMFEHVGIVHYDTFFRTVSRCLAPDGVALIHAIGRPDGPGVTNAWLRKYIFPGGYTPALSEVLPPIERSGLLVTDIEILRLHYAETLRHWRERFARNRDAVAALYDERFCRMWEFYLTACELTFRHQGHMVWQAQLAHRAAAVPLTRDYISRAEAEAAARTAAQSPVSTGT
ncbi:cyclopropane-fatty-acyl-phospholipid synthase family protein [Elioraea tepida]|uniref:Cyclopropane-fatty-acyl-phospholipid synthase family protein n=1 Tax=Elioraea tepida TaxID=2843330 RepID=A0A975TZK3_9PROT|nr:cyclopropane-fatty-acyl-phospholipid synthase family protein [Elioraea tepida]QXM23480.1 cyclopropane-fatty-acyl-phospholipid synthase family protein [Elioraea tepida]